ncbi:hypothetical protein [Streptomyces cucumeris]|uniref:hypothetical protein n=1 Tax=Streptomyces cucumeris TaxID=2962890 RepID=UPI003D74638D
MTTAQLATILAAFLGAHLAGVAAIACSQDRLAQRRHEDRAQLDRELVDALNAYNASKEH